jgi:hypothetical protein
MANRQDFSLGPLELATGKASIIPNAVSTPCSCRLDGACPAGFRQSMPPVR